MPELPEVETVRQILLKQITGKTIQNIKIYYNGILENVAPNNFVNSLVGETICDIKRYGKYLFFILENPSTLYFVAEEREEQVSDDLHKGHRESNEISEQVHYAVRCAHLTEPKEIVTEERALGLPFEHIILIQREVQKRRYKV